MFSVFFACFMCWNEYFHWYIKDNRIKYQDSNKYWSSAGVLVCSLSIVDLKLVIKQHCVDISILIMQHLSHNTIILL